MWKVFTYVRKCGVFKKYGRFFTYVKNVEDAKTTMWKLLKIFPCEKRRQQVAKVNFFRKLDEARKVEKDFYLC